MIDTLSPIHSESLSEVLAPSSGQFAGSNCLEKWLSVRNHNALDVVLITHPRDEYDLPRLFPGAAAMALDDRRAVTRHLKPIFGEIVRTDHLNVGILFLPVYADQMMDPRERKRARQLLDEGL